MEIALGLIALVATVLVVSALCERFSLSSPLVLIAVGILGSFLPFVPEVELSPEVVLLGLLPPLLYAAALSTSLVDFNANRRPILLLSVGLVIFTTVGVAGLTKMLIPGLPWWAAFAIGAVVAPPDAVAATTIGRRIGLPRQVVTILEGESLLNDATALVALRTAIAATVTWQVLALDFLIAAGGGVLVGLVFFKVVALVRRRLRSADIDVLLSFVTPFAAYVAAEEIEASGVLAVVVSGLLLGHKAPVLQTAQSRISERLNWSSVTYLLESVVFLLIGLQGRRLLDDVVGSELGAARVALVCGLTLLAVIALRLLWLFASRFLLLRPRSGNGSAGPPWTYTAILGWAGMRGVVTLAAAFVIPENTPHREVLLLIAFTVTAGTLFVQGFTLPWLAHRLRVPSPDPSADALARATVLHQASTAGILALEGLGEEDPYGVDEQLRGRVRKRDYAAWEQMSGTEDESPSETYVRRRHVMIDAERSRVLELRSTGQVPHEVVSQVLAMLDVEESMLDYTTADRQRVRSGTPVLLEGACDHLQQPRAPIDPQTPGECAGCVAEGTVWVHLRMCLDCGYVGCCDSSERRHASRHYGESAHPVMRSIEPGDDWRWCFVDELVG